MSKKRILAIAAMSAVAFSASLHAADQPGATELKLRETLRNTMLQLRTAQNDGVQLQAAKADLEKRNKDLEAQVKLLTQRGEEDRQAAQKNADDLNAKLAALTEKFGQLRAEYEKTATALKTTVVIAQGKEADRKKLEGEKVLLERTVAEVKGKNSELYKLGIEILRRYEKFGLGEALGAKEPFVGTTRVKLESCVQDYQDKLTDQKLKP